MNLMFDFGISLFMLMTIPMYFDFSHVSIWSLFMLSGEEQNTHQEIVVFIYLFVHIFDYV